MFGYLRPMESELLVKEHELYRAVYCGLCRTMRRKISFFNSFTLNYDFVFLALLRAELTGETFRFCQKRCPAHPFKRRNCANIESEALEHTAMVHLALSFEKIKDDLRDTDTAFPKRLILWLFYPLIAVSVRRMKRKNERFEAILDSASRSCADLIRWEEKRCDDPDLLAQVCAEGIAESCAVGLQGDADRLMRSAASTMGRLVYLLDACDDLQKDCDKGSFNPFLNKYGDVESVLERFDSINATLALYARELDRTMELIVHPNRYDSICRNITQKGIPTAIRRAVNSMRNITQPERN